MRRPFNALAESSTSALEDHRQLPLSMLPTLKKLMFLVAVIALTLYIILLAWLYKNQNLLIYPGTLYQGTPEAAISTSGTTREVVNLSTADDTHLTGCFIPAIKTSNSTGMTVLFLYGNGGYISDCWYIANHFLDLGCSVMLIDYPGFGLSKGTPSEKGCYSAADSAYEYLVNQRKIPAGQIVVAGWSLGSSVAIHLASISPTAGLITFSAFTSMAAMASRQYPIVPEPIANLLLESRFPSEEMIKLVHCPILILHGADDRFVPPQMSNQLAKCAPGRVTHLTIPNIGHNNILSNGGPNLYDAIAQWFPTLPR